MKTDTLSAVQTGSGNICVQIIGSNISAQIGVPHLELVPVEKCLKSNPPTRDIDILDPEFQAVSLVGRATDLQFLQAWLQAEAQIAVTTVVGSGGSGKTRLALELLQKLPEGWQGGFLKPLEATRFITQKNLSAWGWQKPTLVVVDYSAMMASALTKWFGELADHGAAKHPLRILLLERHADPDSGWYHDLADSTRSGQKARNLFSPDQPRRVAPLDQASQRRQVLQAGLNAAAAFRVSEQATCTLPDPEKDVAFERQLAKPQWADPLLLLMAALVAASKGLNAALKLSRPDLARELAKRERDRVRRSTDNEEKKDLLAHLYACVTLCGGLERQQAIEVAKGEFEALGETYPGGAGRAVRDLAHYLGTTGRLPALAPDLLGEALLPVTLGVDGAAVAARLSHAEPASVASSLIHSTQDFSPANERWPLEWLKLLVAEGQSDSAILIEIEAALPNDSVQLRELAVEVTRLLIEKSAEGLARATSTSPGGRADLARLLNNLANRQSEMGQRAEALDSITEAVKHYRQLAEANPDAFRPDLAMSLNNLANRQSEMGQRAEALDSITEAVSIRRQLAEANPDAFRPYLAMSLSVFGDCLEGMERVSEGCDAARESLCMLAPYFSKYPGTFDGLAKATCRDYVLRCKKLNVELYIEILKPFMCLFEEGESHD